MTSCKRHRQEEDLPEITKVVRTFESMPVAEQNRLLCCIVDKCTKKQLSFISNIIMPRLKVDILAQLPREISLHILNHLPVNALCRLAQTSSFHRDLVNDEYLWRSLCSKYGFEDCKKLLSQSNHFVDHGCPSPPPSNNYSANPSLVSLTTPRDATLLKIISDESNVTNNNNVVAIDDHKRRFQAEYVLRSNWLNGRCNHFSIRGPSLAIVTCLQFNDKMLAIATDNTSFGLIELYDSQHGNRIRKLSGHEGGVWALEFSDKILVSGGCDRDLRVWDLESGICIHRLRGHTSTIRCLKMIDEKTVVTGSRDNTLRVWDIDKGECVKVYEGHTGSVRCLAVHGNILVSGSYDFTVRVWDLKREKLLHVLQQHHAQIYSVAFNGRFICSGSLDADIRIWDSKSGKCLSTLEGHDALVGHMQLQDNTLVSAGSDGRICVWNVEKGEIIHRIQAHMNSVTTLQFDDKRIISGGDDGIKIWYEFQASRQHRRDFTTGHLQRTILDDVSGVWRLQFNKTKLVCATQRNDDSHLEVLETSCSFNVDYGLFASDN